MIIFLFIQYLKVEEAMYDENDLIALKNSLEF